MRHSLDTKLLQEVMNYLAGKPFAEVAELVSKIQKDATAVAEDAPAAEEQAAS